MFRRVVTSKTPILRALRSFSSTNKRSFFQTSHRSYVTGAVLCATLASSVLLYFQDQSTNQDNTPLISTLLTDAEEKQTTPSHRLENKVAIVTGASTGIGEGIAKRFIDEGARVVFVDINPDGEKIVQQINKKLGEERAVFVKADISKESDVKGFVDLAVKKWGTVDIMVNNAALFIFKSFEAPIEDWQRSFNVNVIGTVLCTRYATNVMKQQKKGGSIINLSSVSAFEGTPNFAIYAMTKGAIMQMTRDFASDLGPYNIRVNAICPGTIWTSATGRDIKRQGITEKEFRDLHSSKNYLNRLGSVEEVAGAALFLASDDSSFVTGSPIFVDGGRESKF
jgi:NAD(P)-dependent dehydrogenase (short-subunit alcohol dehydrogenase family)